MEQSLWGLASQPLRHSDRIWREIHQNEVSATLSTRRSSRKEIVSAASSTISSSSEPYSGNNHFFMFAYFSLSLSILSRA